MTINEKNTNIRKVCFFALSVLFVSLIFFISFVVAQGGFEQDPNAGSSGSSSDLNFLERLWAIIMTIPTLIGVASVFLINFLIGAMIGVFVRIMLWITWKVFFGSASRSPFVATIRNWIAGSWWFEHFYIRGEKFDKHPPKWWTVVEVGLWYMGVSLAISGIAGSTMNLPQSIVEFLKKFGLWIFFGPTVNALAPQNLLVGGKPVVTEVVAGAFLWAATWFTFMPLIVTRLIYKVKGVANAIREDNYRRVRDVSSAGIEAIMAVGDRVSRPFRKKNKSGIDGEGI